MPENQADTEDQQSLSAQRPAKPEAFGRADGQMNRNGESKQKDEENGADQAKGEEKEKDSKDDQPSADKPPFYKRPKLMIILVAVVLACTIGGLIWWLHARQFESTDDAFIDGHIIHVAPRVAGRVLKLNVTDNQWIEKGTVVIEIDPAEFIVRREQALAAQQQAEAQEKQAEASLAVAQANAEQAKADVLVAEANAENARQDLQRFQELPPQARSRQQLDNANATAKTTAATLTAMQKRATATEAQADAAATAIDAAKAQVTSAVAELHQRELEESYTKVTAGQSGWITRRTVEAGNYVQVGQELLVIVPKDVWVTANFKETQLTLMHPGQPVTVSIDSYPDHPMRGHVDSIQAGSGAIFSLLPPENATGNYVKVVQRVPVKIVFDDTIDRILGPGMSVEPKVRIRN